jgi:hypothetical protein
MVHQDDIQRTIRAYVSTSLIMKSEVLSPRTQRYLQDVMNTLEAEIKTLRNEEPSPTKKAA